MMGLTHVAIVLHLSQLSPGRAKTGPFWMEKKEKIVTRTTLPPLSPRQGELRTPKTNLDRIKKIYSPKITDAIINSLFK